MCIHSKIRIVIMTTVVCYGVGDENTLHILTQQDNKFMGRVGQEFRNTLEQIAVEGVGQNKLKQIGGDGPDIRKYTEQLF